MAESFFSHLFGSAKIPAASLSELQAEGIVLLDEDVKGSVTYHNFHRPGMSAGWEKRGLSGSVVLTKTRLLAFNGANFLINVPLTDERLRQMRFTVEDEEVLCVAFDAGLFHSDWSGKIEYRFRTPHAQRFLEALPK